MGGAVIPIPWGSAGAIVRPVPGIGSGVRPVPGGTIRPPVPITPTHPGTVDRPAAKENGQSIARPRVTAREAAEEAEKSRKKDCRCLPSVQCEGKPSTIKQSSRKPWVEYQLYIANMKAAFLFTHENGVLTEWFFGGYSRWDGFWQSLCTLVEAKGAYDWIDKIKNGTGIWGSVLEDFTRQFHKQKEIIHFQRKRTGGNNIKLQWHFKQDIPYKKFIKMNPSVDALKRDGISIHHTPFEDNEDRKRREREEEQFYRDNPHLMV